MTSSHSGRFARWLCRTVATIAIPIKIWNLTRIEMKLEEQERLLLEARLDALQSRSIPIFVQHLELGLFSGAL